MEIKYDNSKKLIYDDKYFITKTINEINVSDLIMIGNNVCKILNKNMSYDNIKIFIKCINIFNDTKCDDILYNEQIVYIPIIAIKTYEFICINCKFIKLYDAYTHSIRKIKIDLQLDEFIINRINDESEIKTIEFKNLIRIIDIL